MPEQVLAGWPNHRFSRFVEAGGIRWHVQQAGRGETVVLVHGTGSSTHSWRDLLPLLAQHYCVVAADLPGHGETGAIAAEGRSIEGMSSALAALLEILDVQPRFCIGHSAGAVLLCRMALDHRIDPRLIVSLNGALVPLRGAAGVVFSSLAKLLATSSLLPRWVAKRAGQPNNVARMLAATGSTIDEVGVELYSRLVSNPRHVAGTLGMMSQWDLSRFFRQLPGLRTPLLLLVASNDQTVSPIQADMIKERVPHAVIEILPGLGHLAHEESPHVVTDHILTIFRRYSAL